MSKLDLAQAREVFDASTDFTIGLEEEFALVDPDSLELVHRFEELRDASAADPLLAESIAALIHADIDDEHRRTLAHGLVGLAEGTGRHWIDDGLDLDPEVLGRWVADLAYAGLRSVHRLP